MLYVDFIILGHELGVALNQRSTGFYLSSSLHFKPFFRNTLVFDFFVLQTFFFQYFRSYLGLLVMKTRF